MNNKKIFMYFAIIMLIMLVLGIGWITIKNHNNNPEIKEYTPEEEITTDQLRRTNIVLYFANKTTGKVETEIRQIDSKLLLDLPNLEIYEKGIIKFYKTIEINNGEIFLVNISDYDDEKIFPIKNMAEYCTGKYSIMNYSDYIYNLEEVLEDQKLINKNK